jgi:polysaccharide chain length determinant protein (PEP-CTERM system associated)
LIRGKALRPEDLLQIAQRRAQILIPFLIVSLGTFAVVHQIPDRYRSETLILVVPQRVPDAYVRATVTTRIQDRLQTLNQQIMRRTRLEPVIREFNLYPDLVQAGLMEDVIDRMRRDTAVAAVRGDAFRIAYTANEPRTAMRVTERLASMYIDENLRDREILADGTNQFLESQLASAKERLLDHEKKLEEYNRRYAGQLPSQVQSNLQVLNNAQMQIQNLTDQIGRDKDRQLTLEGTLTELGAATAPAADPAGPPVETVAPLRLAPSAAELDRQTKELEAMQLRLRDNHPDLARQKRTVAGLEAKVKAEMAELAKLPPGTALPTTPATATDRVEAGRLARIAQIREELALLRSTIAQKERDLGRLHGTVSEYTARVDAAPSRASELIELTRDYDTLQGTYMSLLRKKEDAQIAANLERYQIGEQFKILDPARLPEKPFSPDRPRLYVLGMVAGLGLGLALAVFLEFRDTTLKTDGDVVLALGLPVLALIPELITDAEKAAKRRRRVFASAATAGAAAVVAGILFWVFRGDLF